MLTITNNVTKADVNWYYKEFNYFLAWARNAGITNITPNTLYPLIEEYLLRMKELGCEDAAVDIIKTALYGYCEFAQANSRQGA